VSSQYGREGGRGMRATWPGSSTGVAAAVAAAASPEAERERTKKRCRTPSCSPVTSMVGAVATSGGADSTTGPARAVEYDTSHRSTGAAGRSHARRTEERVTCERDAACPISTE
jgi:hypothetical protein